MKQTENTRKKGTDHPENEDDDFPGYPHYKASEDIFNTEEEVDVNVDDPSLPVSEAPDKVAEREKNADESVEKKSRNEADITEDDLIALGDQDTGIRHGEDEAMMKDRLYPIDLTGEDLDVPGTELDDANEEIGEEDEENNFYSLPEDQ